MVNRSETTQFRDVLLRIMQIDACVRNAHISRLTLSPGPYLRNSPSHSGTSGMTLRCSTVSNSNVRSGLLLTWRPCLHFQLQVCGPEHPPWSDKCSGRGVAEPFRSLVPGKKAEAVACLEYSAQSIQFEVVSANASACDETRFSRTRVLFAQE